jgi:hypothetical protein
MGSRTDLPQGESAHDQWHLAEQVRESGREAVALAAVQRAAAELAAEFQDVVVLTFDYEGEEEELAEALDRIPAPGAPLRSVWTSAGKSSGTPLSDVNRWWDRGGQGRSSATMAAD